MPTVPRPTDTGIELDAARRVARELIDRIEHAHTGGELNRIAADAARAAGAAAELELVQLRFYQRCRELWPDQVGPSRPSPQTRPPAARS